MARGSTVTYSSVARAANTITESGESPTVEKVRRNLGSGSNSTIAPLLKRWKEENEFERAGNTLPTEVLGSVKHLHEQLKTRAQAQIEHAREEWDKEKQMITETMTNLRQQTTLLAREKEMLQEQKKEQEQMVDKLEKKLSLTQKDITSTIGQLEVAQYEIQEITKANVMLQERITQQEEEMDRYHQIVIEEREKENQAFQASLSAEKSVTNNLRDEVKKAMAEKTILKELCQRMEKKNEEMNNNAVETAIRLGNMETQNQLLDEKMTQLTQKHDALSAEYKKLMNNNKALLVDIHRYKTESALYKQRIEAMETTLREETTKTTQYQRDHDALVAENAKLKERHTKPDKK